MDCSLVLQPKDATPPISWRKLSRIAIKPRNSSKFFPSKFPAIWLPYSKGAGGKTSPKKIRCCEKVSSLQNSKITESR